MLRRVIAIFITVILIFTLNIYVFAKADQDEETDKVIYVYADNDYNDQYSGQGEIDTTIDHTYIPLSEEALEDIQTHENGNTQIQQIQDTFVGSDTQAFFNAGNSVYVVSEDDVVYLQMLQSYLAIMAGLNNSSMSQTLPDFNTGLLYYDRPYGLLSDNPYFQRILGSEIQNYFSGNYANLIVGNPNLTNRNWEGIFSPGQYTVKDLGGQSLCFPTDSVALYNVLQSYLQQCQASGQTTLKIKKLDVYSVSTYGYRTIKISSPLSSYHWTVSGEGTFREAATTENRLPILFTRAGTYNVQVFNIQNVIRNNKVGGTKSELWVLNNGNQYDGIVVYNTSTSFEAFIGEDIGPQIEEVELLDDGFTANVTEQMINSVQCIDSNGNIHTPADNFTTERIE